MAGLDSNAKGCFHFNNSAADASTAALTGALGGTGAYSATAKFGSHALSCPGAGYFTINDDAALDYGAGDFTWDYWVNFTVTGAAYMTYRGGAGGSGTLIATRFFANTIDVFLNDVNVISAAWTPSTSTYYHHALVRSGTNVYFFVDGTQLGSTGTSSATLNSDQSVTVGEGAGVNFLNGLVDEFRMSNVARWTGNFTAPTAEYSADTATGNFFMFF